ncbi:MAG: DUF1848 domain-containing protein [Roseburia sp.]|nr:DUF1848 domain-containing protein [Roseburia sp.]
MILSVSRRTDIPNYYSEWFINRIKEGYLYVRNPMNIHQISRIDLSPEIIDCIVFWTKNPLPMVDKLDELKGYHYYFQFTLTGYGKDIEPNLPDKRKQIINTFCQLSSIIGKEKVIWRYDPILFTDRYTAEYHIKAFGEIAEALRGHTDKVVISFVDLYAKTKKNMKGINIVNLEDNKFSEFVLKLSDIARKNGLKIAACAEEIDLLSYGIEHNCCIDKELIEKIIGCEIATKKDKNQREECGCIESIEVGSYDTCKNACKYCYANDSDEKVSNNCRLYDSQSPLLCGIITKEDKITERKVKSIREEQISIFDFARH